MYYYFCLYFSFRSIIEFVVFKMIAYVHMLDLFVFFICAMRKHYPIEKDVNNVGR